VHINLLKRIDSPLVLGKDSHPLHDLLALHIPKSDPVPWINTEVIITQGHAMKAHHGIILDILCNQQTSSGLQVHLRLSSYDPTSQFRVITLDYDCIVEAKYVILINLT
jgi:hypothetical protein